MPIITISVDNFLEIAEKGRIPLVDARSESEFRHAHIPGAINIPLLNDAERIVTGTLYKQKGRGPAVLKGLELVGPRFHEIVLEVINQAPDKKVLLYCWRGGMRSRILAWLLDLNGMYVSLLDGGYKRYRNHVRKIFSLKAPVMVLGGRTGSGKSAILGELEMSGEQVLPLERIANHKGSAFGGLGLPPQPTNEQFENLIALYWNRFNHTRTVWIENESRSVGSCIIPAEIYALMREATLIDIDPGIERRKERITNEYGSFPAEVLAETSKKIKKRLGPQHLVTALKCLEEGDFQGWLDIVLGYYDKLYDYGNSTRNQDSIHYLDLSFAQPADHARCVKEFSEMIIHRMYNEAGE